MRRIPLVSVLITAHNRPEELRQTLRQLRQQRYRALDLLVIDDASSTPIEDVVREEWPEAEFHRNERNLGLIGSRTLGMARVRGDYMLVLDDDSAPVDPMAIALLVSRFEREQELGVITCHVVEGLTLPANVQAPAGERYVQSYTGCGHMMRVEMMHTVGGYRDYFTYYGEESEYALRVFNAGWRILYLPSVVIHHRMSVIGRSNARITAYNFRNTLWTVLLDLPFPRLLLDGAWKLGIGSVELLKQGNVRWALWAVGSFATGLSRVLADRQPVSATALRAYDNVRFRTVRSPDMLTATAPSLAERLVWFRRVWWHRRRAAAFWNRQREGIGRLAWVAGKERATVSDAERNGTSP
ncbi:MAG: glycosyl transferase, family 2 [Gemmatimonadetes bacterium]|nr:glycosyl transferase, family 2 [Gemmatimonadota bacterium]